VGSETKKAVGQLRRQLDEVTLRVPFDARPCPELTAYDLAPDLVEWFLQRADSGLAGAEHTLEAKLRGLGLLSRVNGHEAPLNAALLFFTSEPFRRFRGAKIEIVQFDDEGEPSNEQAITGSLPTLLEQALVILDGLNPTRVRKHNDRAAADRDSAWPFAAVKEALVNAVHHRGYDPENPDPVKVYIHSDRMVITSYPGPMPGLTHEQLERGEVVSVRARNKHISELLKGIRLAEARGSGITKIRRAMERAGNPPPRFAFDEPARTYFEVTLPIHPVYLPRAQSLPLRVGVPAPASELVGRAAIIAQVNRMLALRSVCLLAPPGRGASSLLNGLEAATTADRRHHLDMRRVSPTGFDRYVNDLLEQQSEGQRLTLLLDHVEEGHGESLRLVLGMVQNANVRVVAAPVELVADEHPWWAYFDPLVVPPLSSADARSLAARLLAGVGHLGADALALAIEQASAGIPRLIHLLVARVHVDPTLGEPGRIAGLLGALVAERGDPTGLRARADELVADDFEHLQLLALDRAADAPAGLSPDDLRAALVDGDVTPAHARHAVQSLLDAGWLVERDGHSSFEHPTLQEHWKAARQHRRAALWEDSDDIPF
jgi:hypothetical protein